MSLKIEKKIASYSVVAPGTTPTEKPKGGFTVEADRRLEIKDVPSDLEKVLYLERRPASSTGHPARVYMINSPTGKFPLVITQTEDENPPWMFELWLPGEAPRGMRALAKNLSMDMRARDNAWLQLKLEAALETEGTPFELLLPDGTTQRVSSDAAAVATLALWRARELGMFHSKKKTPLVNAMMSRKEPKTTAEGAAGWTFDVKNGAVADDFNMTLKEATLPDGTIRPVSVWMAGKYPRSLDALCKVLSLDMRVYPIAWVLRKLDQLVDIEEPNGGFLGAAPASDKQKWYPSTEAYIATLILHRLGTLGLIPERGRNGGGPVLQLVSMKKVEALPVAELKLQGGLCSSCGATAVFMESGCKQCRNCNWSACS